MGDWGLSPDGSQVAVPNHDLRSATVRVIPLDAGRGSQREVALPGLSQLSSLQWTARGDGWFLSVLTPVGKRLVYATPDGRWSLLGDIQGWAVPSPDGRRVAFLNPIVAANAWLLRRR